MYDINWLKKLSYMHLLALLSFLNWVLILIISLVNMALLVNLFGFILLMLAFITPFASILYITIILRFIIKRRENYILGYIIIISNIVYLIWGANYIIKYFAKF